MTKMTKYSKTSRRVRGRGRGRGRGLTQRGGQWPPSTWEHGDSLGGREFWSNQH